MKTINIEISPDGRIWINETYVGGSDCLEGLSEEFLSGELQEIERPSL